MPTDEVREYELIVCLECGETAMAWAPVFTRPCTNGGRHGPTQSVIAVDARDVAPLVEALQEAVEMVQDWGAYASKYFQEKHALDGDVAKLQAAIEPFTQQEEEA